jgi:hypothetical protein
VHRGCNAESDFFGVALSVEREELREDVVGQRRLEQADFI